MKALRRAARRLVVCLSPSRRERELADEIESHLQLHVDERLRAGVPPGEARRQAILAFGPVEAIKEAYRDTATIPLLAHAARDLRFAARIIRRTPGPSAAIVLTVGLAIAVNAVVFTILNAAALQPLHVPAGSRLVAIAIDNRGGDRRSVHGAPSMLSYAEFEAVRRGSRALDGVLAFSAFNEATLGGDDPRTVLTTIASCDYFDVLAVRPALGRGLAPRDCARGGAAVAVLSDALWRSAFHADPSVVGRTVFINRSPFAIVGIAPPDFSGTQIVPEDLFVPIAAQPSIARDSQLLDNADASWLSVIGRRRAGASLGAVRGDLRVVASRIAAERQDGRQVTLSASPATLAGLPEIRTMVLGIGAIVTAAVALVLLIACANIAGLLLARASARRHEIAIRLAVGASRARLVQQLLTESLLLAAGGGVLGYVGSMWATRLVTRFILAHLPPGAWPLVFDPRPDWHVMLYAAVLTVATGVAFGLIPALQATRVARLDVREVSPTERPGPRRLQQALVAMQVAVSIILLLSAGLLARGLYRASTMSPGLALDRITVAAYDLPGAGYDAPAAAAFQHAVLGRLAALPGVRATALATTSPLSDQHYETVFIRPKTHDEMRLEFSQVSRNYFDVLQLPILRGRAFSIEEEQSEAALIVTASTARRLWPGQDPLAQSLVLDKIDRPVVGVVQDAQLSRLGRSDGSFVFLPAGPDSRRGLEAIVAGAGAAVPPRTLARAIQTLDPELVVRAAPLADNLEQWRAPSRLVSATAGVLALVAIALAVTGVFATVAYTVSRRTREIGIRIALGADRSRVLQTIVRQTLAPVAAGIIAGIAGAAATSGLLSAMLFGLSPHDPLTFAGISTLFASVAAAACWIPARRALRIDPTIALRES